MEKTINELHVEKLLEAAYDPQRSYKARRKAQMALWTLGYPSNGSNQFRSDNQQPEA